MKSRSAALFFLLASVALASCEQDEKPSSRQAANDTGLLVERYIDWNGNGADIESHNSRSVRLERVVLNGKVGVLGCDSDAGLVASQDRRAVNYLALVMIGASAATGNVHDALTDNLTVKDQVLADGYALQGLVHWRSSFIRTLDKGQGTIFSPPSMDSCGYEIRQIDVRTDRGPISIRRQPDLSEAARAGDLPTVQALLASGAKLNDFTHDEETALAEASGGGHLQIVQALLAAKADVNAEDSNTDTGGDTALIEAARYNQAAIVRTLIDARANVNGQGSFGTTALIEASGNGQLDIVRALLVAGADVNLGTPAAGNPLRAAAEKGQMQVVRILLTAGARIEDTKALQAALENGHTDIADLLRSQGATDPDTEQEENAASSSDDDSASTQAGVADTSHQDATRTLQPDESGAPQEDATGASEGAPQPAKPPASSGWWNFGAQSDHDSSGSPPKKQ